MKNANKLIPALALVGAIVVACIFLPPPASVKEPTPLEWRRSGGEEAGAEAKGRIF